LFIGAFVSLRFTSFKLNFIYTTTTTTITIAVAAAAIKGNKEKAAADSTTSEQLSIRPLAF
jgi:hypothetical protein